MIDRDFIIITGNQGFGKTVWAKKYSQRIPRLLNFCPKSSYDVDYETPPGEWIPEYIELNEKNPAVKFRFGTYIPDELDAIGKFAKAVANNTVILDECALIFGRGELPDWAKYLVYTGREQRINLIVLAQRAANIPIAIRSQATRIVSFRQTEPDDIKALRDRLGSQLSDELSGLDRLECVDWTGPGQIKKYFIKY